MGTDYRNGGNPCFHRCYNDEYVENKLNSYNKPIETKLKELGWTCKFDLNEGMTRTYQVLKENIYEKVNRGVNENFQPLPAFQDDKESHHPLVLKCHKTRTRFLNDFANTQTDRFSETNPHET